MVNKINMERIKTREEFSASLKESDNAATPSEAVNEMSVAVSIDSANAKEISDKIKEIGGNVKKEHDFGVIEVDTDPKLVDDIKKIKDVTDVKEIKKK